MTANLKTTCPGADTTLEVLDGSGVTLTIDSVVPDRARRRTISVDKDELLAALSGGYIIIRKSDLPAVKVVDGYWDVTWGHERAEDEGEQSFREDALLALAQSEYCAAHPNI